MRNYTSTNTQYWVDTRYFYSISEPWTELANIYSNFSVWIPVENKTKLEVEKLAKNKKVSASKKKGAEVKKK